MNLHDRYTHEDHEFRDNDPYATAKYELSLRWLAGDGLGGGSLLNIGCGGGVFNDMADAAGYVVHGVEPDAAAFDLARRRSADRYAVSNRHLLDLTADDAADIVVMHDVLEHIDAETEAVSKVRTLVRDGGVAVVSVPALESLFGYHDRQLGHRRRYTKTTLRRSLSPEFEIRRLRYFGFSLVPLTLWYSRLRQEPYPTGSVQTGLLSKAMKGLCAFEARVPGPIGTSVLAMVRPLDRGTHATSD